MKKLLLVLVLSTFGLISESYAQTGKFTIPTTGRKFRITYGSDRIIFQDTTSGNGGGVVKPYVVKKAQVYAVANKYTGTPVVTVYWEGSDRIVFKAPTSAFRIVGITTSDSLKVKSVVDTF